MKTRRKACIIFCFLVQAFFNSNLFSTELPHPTYLEFLKKFPDGYPKFIGSGNPKSIGAFKMYLQELGYMTFDYGGNSIGFKFYVSDLDENKSQSQSIKDQSNRELNSVNQKFNTFSGASKNINTLTDNIVVKNNISLWIREINLQIQNIIKYPKIAKDRNQSGRVLISISLMPNGELLDVNIEETSGFKSLDQSTVNAINKIKKFYPAPFEAKNKNFTFILPIKFSLDQ